jgi:hypothetical protein
MVKIRRTYRVLGGPLVVPDFGPNQFWSIVNPGHELTRCPDFAILTFEEFFGLLHTLNCVDPGLPSLKGYRRQSHRKQQG